MMDRRSFLKGMGAAAITLGWRPPGVSGQAHRSRVLVVVFQRGAVDGLNMVVPFRERAYYDLRPGIAIPEPSSRNADERALDLDGVFGFHPAMEPLAPLFRSGRLAIVHAAGSPDPTRSHFDAQDYMESATPGVKSTRDGWMNRYLQTLAPGETTPLQGVSIGQTEPRVLSGRASTFSVSSIADARLTGPMAFYRELLSDGVDDAVTRSARELFETLDFLEAKRLGAVSSDIEYPAGQFPQAMRDLAQAIRADIGIQTAFVDIGNWDHHVNEGGVGGQLANRLREFSSGLGAFSDDLGDRVEDVVIVTLSEFGRTVAENGNGGTDHGHGNAMLVLGGPVDGGRVYGSWPGLERDELWEGRDLAVTTDFRDVLAEVLTRHLGANDLDVVFPGFEPSPVGVLA
jgi:uncharacterized protein (DUF1501 family)